MIDNPEFVVFQRCFLDRVTEWGNKDTFILGNYQNSKTFRNIGNSEVSSLQQFLKFYYNDFFNDKF